ncbi:MAG: response regulator [Rhodocyclaceae bacterium]
MKSILIVDDSFSLRQTLAIALRGAGYDVEQASDGADALTLIEQRRFDLIISDLNMPNMDGLAFVRALKSLPMHRFTPIIMLTTESAQSKVAAAREAGARAWVTKPFQPQQLIDAVAKLVVA